MFTYHYLHLESFFIYINLKGTRFWIVFLFITPISAPKFGLMWGWQKDSLFVPLHVNFLVMMLSTLFLSTYWRFSFSRLQDSYILWFFWTNGWKDIRSIFQYESMIDIEHVSYTPFNKCTSLWHACKFQNSILVTKL